MCASGWYRRRRIARARPAWRPTCKPRHRVGVRVRHGSQAKRTPGARGKAAGVEQGGDRGSPEGTHLPKNSLHWRDPFSVRCAIGGHGMDGSLLGYVVMGVVIVAGCVLASRYLAG
jgi:hypothetical protein